MQQIANDLVVPAVLAAFLAVIIFVFVMLRKLVRRTVGSDVRLRRETNRSAKAHKMVAEGIQSHMTGTLGYEQTVDGRGKQVYSKVKDATQEIIVFTWTKHAIQGHSHAVMMSVGYSRGRYKLNNSWDGCPLKEGSWNHRPIRFKTKIIDQLIASVVPGRKR